MVPGIELMHLYRHLLGFKSASPGMLHSKPYILLKPFSYGNAKMLMTNSEALVVTMKNEQLAMKDELLALKDRQLVAERRIKKDALDEVDRLNSQREYDKLVAQKLKAINYEADWTAGLDHGLDLKIRQSLEKDQQLLAERAAKEAALNEVERLKKLLADRT